MAVEQTGSERVIRPAPAWPLPPLGEWWAARELFAMLVWRELAVRYQHAALGFAWVVLQPLAMTAMLGVVFGRMVVVPSGGRPYPLLLLAGLLPWSLAARAIHDAGAALSASQRLVTRIYFPRVLVPLAVVAAGGIELAAAAGILAAGVALWSGLPPAAFALPAAVLAAVVVAAAIGVGVAALDARYRDVRFLLPLIAQLGFFASPIAYSSTSVPAAWRAWYGANPVAGVVELWRWCLLGMPPDHALLTVSAASTGILVIAAVALFQHHEAAMADRL